MHFTLAAVYKGTDDVNIENKEITFSRERKVSIGILLSTLHLILQKLYIVLF